jgi:HEAT repeat protein
MQALANIGPAAIAAVPQLTEMLLDEAPWVRQRAGMALRRIVPERADQLIHQAQQHLVRNPPQAKLRDGQWTYEGGSLNEWLHVAGSRMVWRTAPDGTPIKGVSETSIEAIGAAAIPDIRSALEDTDWQTRTGAAAALTFFDTSVAEGIEALTQVMIDGPDDVTSSAAGWLTQALKMTKAKPPARVESLLESASAMKQARAAGLILRLDPQHAKAQLVVKRNIADLVERGGEALDIKRRRDRCKHAIDLLAQLGAHAEFALPELQQYLALEQKPGWIHFELLRVTVIKIMGQLGPAAKVATPTLLELLKSRDLRVRGEVSRALPKVVSGDVPAGVIALTRSTDVQQQISAVWTMRGFGRRAIPHLQALLEDYAGVGVGVRQEVLQTLLSVQANGAPMDEVLPILKAVAANDPDVEVRRMAETILKHILQQPRR